MVELKILFYCGVIYSLSSLIIYYNGPKDIIANCREWVSERSSFLDEVLSCMYCFPFYLGGLISLASYLLDYTCTPAFLIYNNITPVLGIALDAIFSAGVVSYLNDLVNHE